MLAGLLAGLSGWLYAHMQRFVNPTPFDIRPGIELLFMALVGGAGQIAGAVVGAAIVVLLKNVLAGRASRRSRATARSSKIVLFGVLFIVLLQKARGGVVPMIRRYLPRPRRRCRTSARRSPAARAQPSPAEPVLRSSARPSGSARWPPSTT